LKLEFSAFLDSSLPLLKRLVNELGARFPFVSVLGQDSASMSIRVSGQGISVTEAPTFTKRGFVLRLHNGRGYAEYSFNKIDADSLDGIIVSAAACAESAEGSDPLPDEEALTASWSSEFEKDPDELGCKAIVERLSELRQRAMAMSDKLTDVVLSCSWQKKHMAYVSSRRELTQSALWTNAAIITLASDGTDMKDYYMPLSGLCGAELLDSLDDEKLKTAVNVCVELLNSETIEPGEYECVCDPETTGMIVHEAFGHGVEMDMFVKNRALAKEYLGRPVASPLVTMHDGALAATECATFLFDDEGTSGTDTLVIDRGILVSGYADALSAARLNVPATGNGRRESYERKSYTRMTNTFFEAGSDKLEDMIASIKYGFLLENPSSGMEDPKNWGIQCMVNIAREIRDGALTGRVFSPIVLTGYVPDLLSSISMVSERVELGGSGYCGKGHKEWVKVSDGGAYIKARVRLG